MCIRDRANSTAIDALNRGLTATNTAVAANRTANEANSNSIVALNRGLTATNTAVAAVQAATDLNAVAIASTNQAVVATNTATAANSAAVRSSNQALRALAEALKVQHLNNHGTWFYQGELDGFSANVKKRLSWTGVRGDVQGCSMRKANNGDYTYVYFHEAGDWQAYAKLLGPSPTPVGPYRGSLTINVHDDTGKLVHAFDFMRESMQVSESIDLLATFHVPKPGYTAYVGFEMSKRTSSWLNNSGTANWTEFSVRQLSRVGQPEIPAELLA